MTRYSTLQRTLFGCETREAQHRFALSVLLFTQSGKLCRSATVILSRCLCLACLHVCGVVTRQSIVCTPNMHTIVCTQSCAHPTCNHTWNLASDFRSCYANKRMWDFAGHTSRLIQRLNKFCLRRCPCRMISCSISRSRHPGCFHS